MCSYTYMCDCEYHTHQYTIKAQSVFVCCYKLPPDVSENLLRYVVTEVGSHNCPTKVPTQMVGTFERDVRAER